MPSDPTWWTSSQNSSLLVLALIRAQPPPVSTVDAIDTKFRRFEHTYLDLLETLRRVDRSTDALDTLQYCSLHQTVDEYNDFKYDSNALLATANHGSNAGYFTRRPLEKLHLGYDLPRYVYTDQGIQQLLRKMEWQITIMQEAKYNILLSYSLKMQKDLDFQRLGKERDYGSFGKAGNISQVLPAASGAYYQRDSSVDNTFRSDFDLGNPLLSLEEIEGVIEPLRARFQKTDKSSGLNGPVDYEALATYSQQILKTLKETYPTFITRKRVYFKDESGNISQTRSDASRGKVPATGKVATIKIQPTAHIFNPSVIDVVTNGQRKYIISTDATKGAGILHTLPLIKAAFPSTDHRHVAPSTHDTEVGIEDECVVNITGSTNDTVLDALPLYDFPSPSDMLAFQSAVRDKLIRHSFDVDSIRSKQELETSFVHLKIWSDFGDREYTISFYAQKHHNTGTHLEYPVECFDSRPESLLDDPSYVRIYFRLPPEPYKAKRASRGSTSNSVISGMAMDIRNSFMSKSRSHSSEESPIQSPLPSPSRNKFWKRRASGESISQSPPTGRSHHRTTPSSASVDTQFSIRVAETDTNSNAADHPLVYPNAAEMIYLNIKFTSLECAELFTTMFAAAQARLCQVPKVRSDSIFLKAKGLPSLPEPAAAPTSILMRSPEALSPVVAKRRSPLMPVLVRESPPIENVVSGQEADQNMPYGGAKSKIDDKVVLNVLLADLNIPYVDEKLENDKNDALEADLNLLSGGENPKIDEKNILEADLSILYGGAKPRSDEEDILEADMNILYNDTNPKDGVESGRNTPSCSTAAEAAARKQKSRVPTFSLPPRRKTASPLPSRQGTGLTDVTRSGAGTSQHPPSLRDYTVGWICAVKTEYVAALELLDEEYEPPSNLSVRDDNLYGFGRIKDHNVVVSCLPKGKYGLTSAASVAKDMLRSFEDIRIGLMVGIGGGAPSTRHDIRLGDVVVSTPDGRNGGVVHYEFGKAIQDKTFEYTGSLAPPPQYLLSALQKLDTAHSRDGHHIATMVNNMIQRKTRLRKTYQKPDTLQDVLYRSSFIHQNDDQDCAETCFLTTDQIVQRVERDPDDDNPVVHYGLIASADRLMKNAHVRDDLSKKHGVLCFEMEAAGLMDHFPCVVIRGICDYSDTHKNDVWQGYAAATAAAYAKELLAVIPASAVRQENVALGASSSSYIEHSPERSSEPFEPVDMEALNALRKGQVGLT